jgi:protein LSM14
MWRPQDDFFDMMSCEALEKVHLEDAPAAAAAPAPTNAPRRTMAEQRKLDIETFGGVGGMRHHYHRWGRGQGDHPGVGRLWWGVCCTGCCQLRLH